MICKCSCLFVACLLTPLTMSFKDQKFIILIKCNLLIRSFIHPTFGVLSNTSLPKPRSQRFYLDFIVLGFIYGFIINFELIIYTVCSTNQSSHFFLHMQYPIILVPNAIYFPLNCLGNSAETQLSIYR